MSGLCNYWADQGREVTLLTLRDDLADHYPLDDRVTRVSINFFWSSKGVYEKAKDFFARLKILKSTILSTQPDVVVSFIEKTNIHVLLSLRACHIPVIVSERSVPGMWPLSKSWQFLRRISYPKATAVVAQTENVAAFLEKQAGARKTVVIPNSAMAPGIELPAVRKSEVVAMGRLSEEKGFDRLLDAWVEVDTHGQWRLLIYGEGKARAALESRIRRLDLRTTVSMPGKTSNPHEIFASASLFVLSSRYEGFPNVLLEAMASGLPSISFDCPGGPAEIVRDGVDGYLVPDGDVSVFAAKIQQLIDDPEARKCMATRAIEVVDRFSQQSVFERWDRLIDAAIQG